MFKTRQQKQQVETIGKAVEIQGDRLGEIHDTLYGTPWAVYTHGLVRKVASLEKKCEIQDALLEHLDLEIVEPGTSPTLRKKVEKKVSTETGEIL